jgi:assimilatory nitrate reductase catalytic subunit
MLLSGKSTDGLASAGPIVCACFGVGRTTICDTIAGGAHTPAEIGAKLKAGTNCGSCIPELKRLIAQAGSTDPEQSQLAAAGDHGCQASQFPVCRVDGDGSSRGRFSTPSFE